LLKDFITEAGLFGVFSVKGAVLRSVVAAILLLLLAPQLAAAGSYSVPVGNGAYQRLERLEAEGLIKSGIIANRPITRHEAQRLLDEAVDSPAYSKAGEGALRAIERLKVELGADYGAGDGTYFKPFERVTLKYASAGEEPHYLNLNNMGDSFRDGSNFRAGFSAHAGLWDKAAFYINPEFRYSASGQGDAEVEIVEGYASLTLWNIEITAGRQALWWGPGQHGTLLLTDNARPFDLIKITNPRPVLLPSVLRYMGPVRLTAFITRLEKDRDVSRPYLAGIRLDLKPYPYIEIGVSRVAMFGGGDREVTAWTLWDAFTARNENSVGEPGNQLASMDLKLIVPWQVQPFVLYAEVGGEDEAGNLPSRGAYMAGLYLPRLLGYEAFSARFEYADNRVAGYPHVWYRHHIYTTGYTFKGRVIGHHMGTDATDFFSEVKYSSSRMGDFIAVYNIERGLLYDAVNSRNEYYAISWERIFADMYEARLDYAYDRRENIGGVADEDKSGHSLFMELGVSF